MEVTRSSRTARGSFSPASNSFLTTVISESRSFCAMKLFTIRSASNSSAQMKFSSVAGTVSK